MSELFDSLNLNNAAGPSSSQQSSSQPSTSKVFWHASPSPGVLRQLGHWTPSRSQESPTLPLCTQAFVGELKKLPGVLEAQSPLLSRASSTKRKFLDGASRASDRHVSDPTAARGKVREHIILDLSDDDEEEVETGIGKPDGEPTRLLLGDAGESSPESRRRRTMDAGHTGRLRQPSSSSDNGASSRAALALYPQLERDQQPSSLPHRRLDRRPPRRRKKESFMAGLGFTDDSGGATDCLKLFENLQAAIQGMQASRPSTSGSGDSHETLADQRPTATAASVDAGSDAVKWTPREGINRTTSAPTSARTVLSQEPAMRATQQEKTRDEMQLQPRRVLRPVKSEHDAFKAAAHADLHGSRALQPRATNLPRQGPLQSRDEVDKASLNPTRAAEVSHPSQARAHDDNNRNHQIKSVPVQDAITKPSTQSISLGASEPTPKPSAAAAAAATTTTPAQPSPVKRSARIEAMQAHSFNSTAKKLGVRAPSMLSKSTSATSSPRRSTATATTAPRSRTHPLAGMTQARQPGLPRNCSQFASSQSQAPGPVSGPAAPFRPPAATARVASLVRTSPVKVAPKPRAAHPASSDDSFADDDDAFLALACELEY